jgi:aspartate aminotransferase
MPSSITPSATVELSRKIDDLKRSGTAIIELNIGEPDFPTPTYIKSAAKRAIDKNFTKYTTVAGIPELRRAVCHKLETENKLRYQPNEIIVTTGAKQALILALMAVCRAGDEVIIPTPCWVSFIEMVKIAGAKPVAVETDRHANFQLDHDKIRQAVSNKTKALILNSPNNPTGAVYTKDALAALAQSAYKHDFYLISDEIYETIVYDRTRHYSIASVSAESRDRTIVVNGLSKAFAMTGWRIGYAAGPQTIVQTMCTLQGHMTTCTNSVSQWAALAALKEVRTDVEQMRRAYQDRRDFIQDRLQNIPNVTCPAIQGTFYAFPDITHYFDTDYKDYRIRNATDLAHFLLMEGGVAVVPGDAFQAPEHIRISFANSMDNLERGCDQIARCLSLLK